jgi:hypothetical protein
VLTIVEECEEEGGSYADKSLCAWAVADIPREVERKATALSR